MSIVEDVLEVIEEKQDISRNMDCLNSVIKRIDELKEEGILKEPTYGLPTVDTMGRYFISK